MFVLDLAAYGYGLGLVMCGWIAGMLVNYVLVTAGIIGRGKF